MRLYGPVTYVPAYGMVLKVYLRHQDPDTEEKIKLNTLYCAHIPMFSLKLRGFSSCTLEANIISEF